MQAAEAPAATPEAGRRFSEARKKVSKNWHAKIVLDHREKWFLLFTV